MSKIKKNLWRHVLQLGVIVVIAGFILKVFFGGVQITQLERQVSHGKINGTIVQSLQLLRTQITHRRIRPRWDHHVHLHVIPRNSLHEITLGQDAHANRPLLILILSTSHKQGHQCNYNSYFHYFGYIKFSSSITSNTSVRYLAASYLAIGKLCNK